MTETEQAPPRTKLTAEKVRQIRGRRGESQEKLAEEFGVNQSTISSVQNRRTWRHIK